MDNVPVHTSNQTSASRNIGGRPNGIVNKGKTKRNKIKLAAIAAIVAFIVIIVALMGLFFYRFSTNSAIDGGKYQVVFLTDNQFYFGKLHTLNGDFMKLTDIYYIQTESTDSTNPQKTTSQDVTNLKLVKLGNEIHGPSDEMVISKDKILYFENLKNDGKVVKSIKEYQSQNK